MTALKYYDHLTGITEDSWEHTLPKANPTILKRGVLRDDDIVGYLSIKPNGITRYARRRVPKLKDFSSMWKNRMVEGGFATLEECVQAHKKKCKKPFGLMSSKANSRMNVAIDWMVLLAKGDTAFNFQINKHFKFKLNFITLTLASKQIHSDAKIKKDLLNQFLVELRTWKKIKRYVWRAEAQANGNIHFHIILDKYIYWKDLQDMWNRIQEKLGYVTRSTSVNPNSADVHSLTKVGKIGGYLSKYCSKNSKGITILKEKAFTGWSGYPYFLSFVWNKLPIKKNKDGSKSYPKFYRQINGKLWGLSTQLSKLKQCKVEENELHTEDLMHFQTFYSHRVKKYEYATRFIVGAKELAMCGLFNIREVFREWLRPLLNPQLKINVNNC